MSNQAAVDEVYLLFKTHLDVGFTDLAANVIDTYMTQFIPSVLDMKQDGFRWTTGSWLIHEFLERADDEGRARMEEAIRKDRIFWHGLPFTTHTEAMNPALFEYGLSISEELDRRFGKKTIAAKMTDVPGHTRAMIPLLVKHDIQFLHLGKNPFCTAPSVPPLFRWMDGDGCEIIVMYEKEYGSFSLISGTGKAVYFAHTYDNKGAPSPEDLETMYAELRERFPGAKLTATSLNTVALAAASVRDTLPIVRQELGDSWIHGIGCDPRKLNGYRALMREATALDKEQARAVYQHLIMVPEHTWGADEKKYLNDHEGFVRTDFEKRRQEPNYQIMERSWEEQRTYVTKAAEAFPQDKREKALALLEEYKTEKVSEDNGTVYHAGDKISVGDAVISFSAHGAVEYLTLGGVVLADADHQWAKPMYEAFCQKDYDRFMEQYITERPMPWYAVEDLSKIGIDEAIDHHLCVSPRLTDVVVRDKAVTARMAFEGEAHDLYGAPATMEITFCFQDAGTIHVDAAWFDKPATRVAEAIWLGFCPNDGPLQLHKLGEWIDPLDVIENGNRHLHGLEYGVKAGSIVIQTLDAGLVAPGKPSLLDFNNRQPDLREGFYFNLFNNIWGTNFKMWYEEDARFRFVIRPGVSDGQAG